MKRIKKIKHLLLAFEKGITVTTQDRFDVITGQAILKQYKSYYKFYISDEDWEKIKPKKKVVVSKNDNTTEQKTDDIEELIFRGRDDYKSIEILANKLNEVIRRINGSSQNE